MGDGYPISYQLLNQIFKELQWTMWKIKDQKHGAFYESSYLPNYAIHCCFQNPYLDVWKDSH